MCGDLAEQTKINRKLMEMLHLELEPVGIFFGNISAELSYYAQMAIYVFMGLVIPATTQSSHFVPCNSEGRRIQ